MYEYVFFKFLVLHFVWYEQKQVLKKRFLLFLTQVKQKKNRNRGFGLKKTKTETTPKFP